MELTRRTLALTLKPANLTNSWVNEDLVYRMRILMQKEGGIGLASNQCGERVRMFIMLIDEKFWECFNPEITECSTDLTEFNEGCLSFKGDSCIIKRPSTINVKYYNAQGNKHVEVLEGLPARCFQHELDHLNGITMHDRYKEQNAEQPRD